VSPALYRGLPATLSCPPGRRTRILVTTVLSDREVKQKPPPLVSHLLLTKPVGQILTVLQ
jgi:hypothetical protein